MNYYDVVVQDELPGMGGFLHGKFVQAGKIVEDGPEWAMSLRSASSMRFRWNETNRNRIDFLSRMADGRSVAQVELIHSRIVYPVDSAEELFEKTGDGIITKNRNLLPTVTVADCMPIFIYNLKEQVFGVLHSGWKGTGIVREAILKSNEVYGTSTRDFCIVMGPHIHDCCYSVDRERFDYFSENFGSDCLRKIDVADGEKPLWALSLARANLNCAVALGVPEENILVSPECTCCNEKFGSFRRENPVMGTFTVQAAWVKW